MRTSLKIEPSSFEGMKELKRILLEVDIVLRYSDWNHIVISDNVYLDRKYVKNTPDNLFRNYKGKVCSADLYYLPLDESFSNIRLFSKKLNDDELKKLGEKL